MSVETAIRTEQNHPATRDHVVATLNYTSSKDGEPEWYSNTPAPGVIEQTPQEEPRSVRIYSARSKSNPFTIDTAGFQLTQFQSDVPDFHNEEDVQTVYYPETEALVKRLTGASRVLAFDHNLRSTKFTGENEVLRKPSVTVHGDYTATSAPRRVRQLLPVSEAEDLLKKRYAFINVWKPVGYPVETNPLVLCDARSVSAEDFVRTALRYADRTGEVYTFRYNPNHRWFYFPRMQPDEALLIKCFDSKTDGRARFVPHTSFDDPTSPPNARPRVSIEMRTVAFFD